jgi:hypothetical protein
MHANTARIISNRSSSEGLLFSTVFVGTILAVMSALCAIDLATVRALFSIS